MITFLRHEIMPIGSYGFFDDCYTLAQKGYHGQDKLSLFQFVFMGCMFVLIVIASMLLRRIDKKKLFLIYKVLSIAMILSEIAKITYSTYFDLVNGQPFNVGGILPLYTCSIALYLLPFLAWGKGKVRDCAAAWFTTIGLAAGLSNFVYLSAAYAYPILSYGGMYSVLFHVSIAFVGMSLLITESYTVTFRTVILAMIPTLIAAVFVIPANLLIYQFTDQKYVDYMLLMDCNGFGGIADMAYWLRERGMQIVFSFFILLVGYPLAGLIVASIDMGLSSAVKGIGGLFRKQPQ